MERRKRRPGWPHGGSWKGAGTTSVLRLVVTLGVLPLPATSVLCPLSSNSVLTTDLYTYFFSTDDVNLTAVVRSEECRINSSVVVPVSHLSGALTDSAGRSWHKFGFAVDDTTLTIRLGEDARQDLVFTRSWDDLSLCSSIGLEFSFPPSTRLARNCSIEEDVERIEDTPQWNNNCTVVLDTILTDFYDLDNSDVEDPREENPGYSGGHIIFIPLGAIVFVVTVCLRFCLCPKRSLAGAPRSRLQGRRRLSINSEAGGSLTTMNYDLDLPPAYSELQNEDTPPPYSEVEKVRLQPYEEPPPPPPSPPPFVRLQMDSEAQHTPVLTPADTEGDVSPSADSSGIVKVLTSRPRTLQSQFSHKPLEEEKPPGQT